jgi:hypothetical protein
VIQWFLRSLIPLATQKSGAFYLHHVAEILANTLSNIIAYERFFGQKPRSMFAAILDAVDLPLASRSPQRKL